MKIKNIIILVLVVLLVIFLLQNTEVIEVRFLFWEIPMSKVVLLFSALVAGLIVGWFLRSFTSKKPRQS